MAIAVEKAKIALTAQASETIKISDITPPIDILLRFLPLGAQRAQYLAAYSTEKMLLPKLRAP